MKEIFTIKAIRKHLPLLPQLSLGPVLKFACNGSLPSSSTNWLSIHPLPRIYHGPTLYSCYGGFGIGCGMRKDILTALSLFFHVKRQIVIISTYSVPSSSPYFFGKQWIVCGKRPKHGLLKVFLSFPFPTSSHCTPNDSFVLFSLQSLY